MNNFFFWACGAIFGASMFSLVLQTKAKRQATKANQAQVELHIQRQKELGELMINDDDQPTGWDLLATAAVVGVLLFGTFKGWW